MLFCTCLIVEIRGHHAYFRSRGQSGRMPLSVKKPFGKLCGIEYGVPGIRHVQIHALRISCNGLNHDEAASAR